MVALWVDDLRTPPEGWLWSKTSDEAIGTLAIYDAMHMNIEEISFDHDLGGDDTTRKVVLWLCEHPWLWPQVCYVHTSNPPGREFLEGMIERYGPGVSYR